MLTLELAKLIYEKFAVVFEVNDGKIVDVHLELENEGK